MNCDILETLYVRSNGDIPCNCDAGEQVILGRVDADDPTWDISKVLTNSKFSHIRDSLSSGVIPWDGICTNCSFFRQDEPFLDNSFKGHIRIIQIEPSLACNLECPCCSSKTQRGYRPKPHLMKLEVLETLIKSLFSHSYSVGEILYAGQGEPLMHPQFPQIVKIIRGYYPSACQLLCTNGNFDYGKATQGVFIDTIYASVDGTLQNSYEKYRVKGDVQKAIKFMKDVPKNIDGMKQHLIWKYILFEFNDSDEEIIAAQHLANSIGVDTLMFVITHSRFKSVKYRPETIANLPILYPNVTTSHTPQLQEESLNTEQSKIKSGIINMLLRKLRYWRPLWMP